MKKLNLGLVLLLVMTFIYGCSSKEENKTEITIAAAASLENAFVKEIIPLYEKENENITIRGVYDASGKLQTQIEEGLNADIFLSAAPKQMNELVEKKYINKDETSNLLENDVVLITNKDSKTKVNSFDNITDAKVIAIGDPDSVPAGQYAQDLLTNIKKWDDVKKKASLGTNVTEVLEWVANGSAEVGIVYASDAKSNENIKVIEVADGKLLTKKAIYPIGLLEKSKNKEEAKKFIEFLKSDKVMEIFEKYGFKQAK